MERLDTAWWPRGHGIWGQEILGMPSVVCLDKGRLFVLGMSGPPLFDEPVAQVKLEYTAIGNLRMTGPGGDRITLLPNRGQSETPLGKRVLRRLPTEVLDNAPLALDDVDPVAYGLSSFFSSDASTPVREVGAVLQANGAEVVADHPYSRARVWGYAAVGTVLVCGAMLLIVWIIALIVS